MGPPVAVIVGGTVVTVGLVVAFHEFAWPHIKPHAQVFVENCGARLRAFRGRRRQRAQPHIRSPLHRNNRNDEDEPKDNPGDTQLSTEMVQNPFNSTLDIHTTSGTGMEKATPASTSTLRQRRTLTRDSSSEKLLEVEMIHLDQANPFITYTTMTPTHSRPSSRAATDATFDIDPFEEPAVPVATAIPLPLSPSSSLIAERKLEETPNLMTRSSTATQSFATAPTQPQARSYSSTPASLATSATLPQQQPQSAFSTVRGRPRHKPSASQTSNASAGVLSPPMISSGPQSNDARSPVARAHSPSGVSDPMSGSFVSAAPSRTWTDGGTADIFSGDERDFQEGEADSDDDIRSVSESGSWESVSATGRDPLAASSRLPRR